MTSPKLFSAGKPPPRRVVQESSDSDSEPSEHEQDAMEDSDDSYYNDQEPAQPTVADDEDDLEKEIADIPFHELQKLKKMDNSSFKEAIKKQREAREAAKALAEGAEGGPKRIVKAKRKNSAPAEVSAAAPVKRLRQVVNINQKQTRDPRFDGLSGNFDKAVFDKRYDFLSDVKRQELEDLKQAYKKERNLEERERIKKATFILEQRLKSEQDLERRKGILQEHKKKQAKMVKEGKKAPFYLKKGDIKELELKKKYEELKKSGGDAAVERYMTKKRKRQASKQHKFVPWKRRATEDGSTPVGFPGGDE